jgi:hypothetical protein
MIGLRTSLQFQVGNESLIESDFKMVGNYNISNKFE